MVWLPLPLGKCEEEKSERVGGPDGGMVQDGVNGVDGGDGERAEQDGGACVEGREELVVEAKARGR